jgi:hypothetical protein
MSVEAVPVNADALLENKGAEEHQSRHHLIEPVFRDRRWVKWRISVAASADVLPPEPLENALDTVRLV